jgi:hypothetical protein
MLYVLLALYSGKKKERIENSEKASLAILYLLSSILASLHQVFDVNPRFVA